MDKEALEWKGKPHIEWDIDVNLPLYSRDLLRGLPEWKRNRVLGVLRLPEDELDAFDFNDTVYTRSGAPWIHRCQKTNHIATYLLDVCPNCGKERPVVTDESTRGTGGNSWWSHPCLSGRACVLGHAVDKCPYCDFQRPTEVKGA